MSDLRPEFDPTLLLEHRDRLRRLALGVVGDEHLAEDVVQQTWSAALERRPKPGPGLKAWLSVVARNFARRSLRERSRRDRREQRAAAPESLPDTAELVERHAVHRSLVDALLSLRAPYGRVLLLRFFQDSSTEEIARHHGQSASTVRSQLSRGLALLREEMDRRHVGKGAWIAAFVPEAAHEGA